MEKKKQSSKGSDTNSPLIKPKIFGGGGALQISEDGASRIIGGIVEKGISDEPHKHPTAPPKPSLLPFPVARHRSHGPHWGPVGTINGDSDSEDKRDGDDEAKDFIEYRRIAPFANPVPGKKKKEIDLSSWRQVVSADGSSVANKAVENLLCHHLTDGEITGGTAAKRNMSSDPSLADANVFSPTKMDEEPDLDIRGSLSEFENAMTTELNKSNQLHLSENVRDTSMVNISVGRTKPDGIGFREELRRQEQSTVVSSSMSNNFRNEQESMSLESQIDAENRTRLQGMSPNEIAQARSEIMEKMDPAIIKALKKRGQDKLKKKKGSSSEVGTNGELSTLQNENIQDAKDPVNFKRDIPHMVTTTSNDSQDRQDSVEVQKLAGAASCSLWTSWSERVEAVRDLRFSLDGTVVKNDFVKVPGIGDATVQNRYGADNVTERDFLRTEGDPGASGYTIKEAVALTRSVVPGQRALAFHLISSVLDKALHGIIQNQVGSTLRNASKLDKNIDWEAVWAFALGPEPELVLSLRMSLDDNHNSVVLACAKAIQCALSCDANESFFEISEKTATYEKEIFTAPVFRSRSEIDVGFLHGGFWKYNAKPSNILPADDDMVDDESEGKHTIQDDIVVGGQDFGAGLVRMGILPRLCYLLETNPTTALEECIISVLVGIARHSPTCANAIMKCQRLVETVVHRFTAKDTTATYPSKIKSISLVKVLAQSDKKNCIEFVNNGTFQTMTRHLYQDVSSSLEHWVKSGRENCKLSSALMVEQLRFWKVCIHYGYCVSYFPGIFPALCLWLNPPSIEKLIQKSVLSEFTSISREAYLVLEALARRLPKLFSKKCDGEDTEIWSWSCVGPMVELAMKWIAFKSDPHLCKLFGWHEGTGSDFVFPEVSPVNSLLWVYSAVLRMLCRVLEKMIPEDSVNLHGSSELVPWLPEFVPKVVLEIVKNGFLSFSGAEISEYPAGGRSFIEQLCHLRQQSNYETSLACVCSLHGFVQVIANIDKLIQLAKNAVPKPSQECSASREGKILEDGILEGSMVELRNLLNFFMKLVASEWPFIKSIEVFGRGGPAPGLGVGWGASGGGFWSATVLLAQIDAGFLVYLIETFQFPASTDTPTVEEMTFSVQRINSAIGVCLIAGPRDRIIVEKALNVLLHVQGLKFLNLCIRRFLYLDKRFKPFSWEYEEEDFLVFSKQLASHFRNRWLSMKKKPKDMIENSSSRNRTFKKGSVALDTIHEDLDTLTKTSQECPSVVEWAHQRLPLPVSWFFSTVSTIFDIKHDGMQRVRVQTLTQDPNDLLEISKAGLFFNLGVEAMSTFKSVDIQSPVQSIPLVWKLHSLSMILLVGMGVLEEEKSRDVYEALQDIYGQLLDQSRISLSADLILEEEVNLLTEAKNKDNAECLMFQSEINESYSTFVETLVEQFSAISYGDFIFGRQVAVYLHRCVEAPIRLAAWNVLTNACVLDLLPPLKKCIGKAKGYLEPVEDNDGILEAYVKSWNSGALDRAAIRGSVAYTLVIHHLCSFIFHTHPVDKLSLRNKLVKSLLRDYSRKHHHEGMMLNLLRCNKSSTNQMLDQNGGSPIERSSIDKRIEVLAEACEGNSSLLVEVSKLKSSM